MIREAKQFEVDLRRIQSSSTPSILMASLISNIMATVLPLSILIVYDRVLPNASEDTLFLLCGGVLVATLLDVISRMARGFVVQHRAARYGHRAFIGAIGKILNADSRTYSKDSTASHLERMGAIDVMRESRAGYLPQLMVDFPFFLLFLGLVFVIGGSLGYVLLAGIVAMGLISTFTGMSVRKRTEARQRNTASQTNFLLEVLSSMTTIKSYNMEQLMLRRYERFLETSAHVTANLFRGSTSAQSLSSLVTQASQIAVVGFGSLLVINGEMTIGGIAASMMLTGRAMQPLNRAAMLWSQHQSVDIAKQRLKNLSTLPGSDNGDGWAPEALEGLIEFEDVSFGYNPGSYVFENTNIRIEPGEMVLIHGDNWSGKSTFLSLVAQIVTPDEGRILVDGIDVRDVDERWLRSQIAYLPQTPALFEGTLWENLTGFSDDQELAESIEKVAEEIGLTSAASKLPRGFQTEIRSGVGEALPASIRQQIPIARELARNPAIIVMDECNSNLDMTADVKFREALERRKGLSTIVFVSPRP